MSNFSNYKKFENLGIRSSNDTLIVMDSSNNNISLHSSDGGDDNVDTLSIKNIINKTPNMDLNLSSLTGNVINPVITINNNNGDCRITTNLNVNGNLNITKNLIIPTHSATSTLLANVKGSIYYNTSENMYEGYSQTEGWQPLGGFSKTKDATIHKNLNVIGNINLTNEGMIKTTNDIYCNDLRLSSGDIYSNGHLYLHPTGNNIYLKPGGIETMKLQSNGRVGIGVSPTEALDVNGNIKCTGTVTAGTFSGSIHASNISGTISSANSAGYATNLTVTNSGASGSTHYVLFASGYTGGNYSIRGYSSLYYTPSNNTLNCIAYYAKHSTAGHSLVDTGSSQTLSNKQFAHSNAGVVYFHGWKKVSSFTHSGTTSSSIGNIHNNTSLWSYDAAQFSNDSAVHQYGDVDPPAASTPSSWYMSSYLSAKFDYGIYVGDGFVFVACDKRNKHLINEINDSKALDIIKKINVYTYYFKDKFGKPTGLQYDVLAQEVQEHFPGATITETDYLSNIVAKVEVKYINTEDNKFKMILETPIEEIKTNKNVRFYGYMKENTKENIYDILDLECIENNNTFIIEKKYDYIICIGTQEDDVLSVNKQALFSLCHSAIQELDKRQIADKERITNLETANQQQQTKIDTLETEISTLKTENTELKSIIDKLKTANSFEEFKNSL